MKLFGDYCENNIGLTARSDAVADDDICLAVLLYGPSLI